MNKSVRSGDVFLKVVTSLPVNAKKVAKNPVLALGEISGHSHRLVGDQYELYQNEGRKYLQVFQPTLVTHEEHNKRIILPGTYEIVNEREYDYIDEELKVVKD